MPGLGAPVTTCARPRPRRGIAGRSPKRYGKGRCPTSLICASKTTRAPATMGRAIRVSARRARDHHRGWRRAPSSGQAHGGDLSPKFGRSRPFRLRHGNPAHLAHACAHPPIPASTANADLPSSTAASIARRRRRCSSRGPRRAGLADRPIHPTCAPACNSDPPYCLTEECYRSRRSACVDGLRVASRFAGPGRTEGGRSPTAVLPGPASDFRTSARGGRRGDELLCRLSAERLQEPLHDRMLLWPN